MEGDFVGGSLVSPPTNFYPRPHMEGDPPTYPKCTDRKNFYPRPHMEGDTSARKNNLKYCGISTHALTWRATDIACIHP